jgi:hypothetical protein
VGEEVVIEEKEEEEDVPLLMDKEIEKEIDLSVKVIPPKPPWRFILVVGLGSARTSTPSTSTSTGPSVAARSSTPISSRVPP